MKEIILLLACCCFVFMIALGAFFLNRGEEGDECEGKDENGTYEIDEDLKCVLKSCNNGYYKSGKECLVDQSGVVCVPTGTSDPQGIYLKNMSNVCTLSSCKTGYVVNGTTCNPVPPTEYVYEFIVKEQTAHTDMYNIHITDIEADGVRITSDQLEMHEEPEWAKCGSKPGGYECEGDNYGINDPEPADGAAMNDLSWSAWKEGQAVVGTKLLTITMPSKVSKFTIDYFRPMYVPGWTIKENGTEVLSTSKGANEESPTPSVVEYTIP